MIARLLLALAILASGSAVLSQRDAQPELRAGFYEVDSFSGSSFGDDAAIWAGRVEGSGTVYAPFDPRQDTAEPELVVRSEPSEAAPIVAYVDFVSMPDGGWMTVYAANEANLLGELQRASHDDYGLVADRVDNGWGRVIYGYTRRGDARRGWIQLAPRRAGYISYDDQIRRRITWFRDPINVALFDRPNGRPIRFSLVPGGANQKPSYTLDVVAIQGDWIQVDLAVPDADGCGVRQPGAKVERSIRAWVRRYDPTGRYQIDYAAGGC